MPNEIHPTATIGDGAAIGHYTVILQNVRVGACCRIGHHVVIHPDTLIGDGVAIEDHAVVGKPPTRSASMAEISGSDLPAAALGPGVRIGVGAVIYRGSQLHENAFIADYAAVREESVIGARTVIGRGAAVENRVQIGSDCKIESGVFIAALSEIGNGCFIAPEVTITNDRFLGRTPDRARHYRGITLREGGRIGANATILPGITVHPEGVAGAGSVVTRDIPERQTVVGNSARFLRAVPDDQLLSNQP